MSPVVLLAALTALTPSEAEHALDQLANTTRVLYVAAHPDDENTRLIAYLTRIRRVEVAYLSLTRGSGGQNRIGTEQSDLLGVLRTGELLSARSVDGARQFFTRARDFGYSKSSSETLEVWDADAVVADAVHVIRTFRPDVVVTRFRETGRTHGHHLASAAIARRAVEAAARPDGSGLDPWTVKRLIVNVPTWRGRDPDTDFEMEVNAFDARLGESVGEIAARSRSRHRSQAFGSAGDRRPRTEAFSNVWGDEAKADLLEGVPPGWSRFKKSKAVDKCLRRLREAQLGSLDFLASAHETVAELERLPDVPRVKDARERLTRVALAASGVFIRATTEVDGVAPGEMVPIRLEVTSRRHPRIVLRSYAVDESEPVPVAAALSVGEPWTQEVAVRMTDGSPTASPWLTEVSTPGAYVAPDRNTVILSRGPDPITVTFVLQTPKGSFSETVPVLHQWVDPSSGEHLSQLARLPLVTVTPAESVRLLPRGREAAVTFELHAHGAAPRTRIAFDAPAGWKVQPSSVEAPRERGQRRQVTVRVAPPKPDASPFVLRPHVVREGQTTPASRLDVVAHPHIERALVVRPSHVRWVPLDLKLTSARVAYVPGAGDRVAELMAEAGLRVRAWTDADLKELDLTDTDVLLLGIRAFNVRPRLVEARERIFRWVEQGGRLVIQYNTNSWFDGLEYDVGPGTLKLGRGRVTDETAEVRILEPSHPVLQTPNRIDGSDWAGWVQERGLYFAESWDEDYVPVVEMADPAGSPERGALLVKRYGRGTVVYTGLSFFRQLPAGVPGAYRLLANLLQPES